mmetsp:Transcript_25476/g.78419  ORF Transcript_25476/g.78419 Transcript_25476/m.78419 type:complete len:118 (-) Transcript_25476:235-588(-)|eukprot:CAMPEP_0198644048 /NCGR_PEP_ID=MMETSP1467-20131203/364_1 /TAXON_ID=1462469 /ORGANISM="unid. sp., Strain CCMP2135" /LENGTH=117 /DNA_ID=CAMNT_0044379493 /DNA_START=28 /DNA_END=381 /DNA_ORIENTATION=+
MEEGRSVGTRASDLAYLRSEVAERKKELKELMAEYAEAVRTTVVAQRFAERSNFLAERAKGIEADIATLREIQKELFLLRSTAPQSQVQGGGESWLQVQGGESEDEGREADARAQLR